MVITASARSGRPQTDLAIAARNRLWATVVKHCAQRSWDDLDADFLQLSDYETKRPRVFWGIARYGLMPDTTARRKAGFDLVTRVANTKGFELAAEHYRSKLWLLLTPPGLDISAKRGLLKELLRERGLYRASRPEQNLGNWIFPDAPAFRRRENNAMQELATYMNGVAILDKIAIFACAYADALHRLDLTEAMDCIHAMRTFLVWGGEKITGLTNDLVFDLVDLITARILKNDWSISFDRARNIKVRNAARAARIALENPRASARGEGTLLPLHFEISKPPIVFLEEPIPWLLAHRERIEQAFEEAGSPYWPSSITGVSSSNERSRPTSDEIEQLLGGIKIPT